MGKFDHSLRYLDDEIKRLQAQRTYLFKQAGELRGKVAELDVDIDLMDSEIKRFTDERDALLAADPS